MHQAGKCDTDDQAGIYDVAAFDFKLTRGWQRQFRPHNLDEASRQNLIWD
jgi:hypothetical protein